MSKHICVLLCLVLLPTIGHSAAAKKPEGEAAKVSYSVGYQIGGDFRRQGWEIDTEMLIQGIRDAIGPGKPLLSAAEMNATLAGLKKRLVTDQQAAAKQESAAYLADNAKQPGVVVLPSGVQYRVLKDGNGRHPSAEQRVTIKYRLSRLKGKELVGDRSAAEPKTYRLEQVLPGLREVLPLMGEGAIWQVVLPPGPAMATREETLENVGVLVYELELVACLPGE